MGQLPESALNCCTNLEQKLDVTPICLRILRLAADPSSLLFKNAPTEFAVAATDYIAYVVLLSQIPGVLDTPETFAEANKLCHLIQGDTPTAPNKGITDYIEYLTNLLKECIKRISEQTRTTTDAFSNVVQGKDSHPGYPDNELPSIAAMQNYGTSAQVLSELEREWRKILRNLRKLPAVLTATFSDVSPVPWLDSTGLQNVPTASDPVIDWKQDVERRSIGAWYLYGMTVMPDNLQSDDERIVEDAFLARKVRTCRAVLGTVCQIMTALHPGLRVDIEHQGFQLPDMVADDNITTLIDSGKLLDMYTEYLTGNVSIVDGLARTIGETRLATHVALQQERQKPVGDLSNGKDVFAHRREIVPLLPAAGVPFMLSALNAQADMLGHPGFKTGTAAHLLRNMDGWMYPRKTMWTEMLGNIYKAIGVIEKCSNDQIGSIPLGINVLMLRSRACCAVGTLRIVSSAGSSFRTTETHMLYYSQTAYSTRFLRTQPQRAGRVTLPEDDITDGLNQLHVTLDTMRDQTVGPLSAVVSASKPLYTADNTRLGATVTIRNPSGFSCAKCTSPVTKAQVLSSIISPFSRTYTVLRNHKHQGSQQKILQEPLRSSAMASRAIVAPLRGLKSGTKMEETALAAGKVITSPSSIGAYGAPSAYKFASQYQPIAGLLTSGGLLGAGASTGFTVESRFFKETRRSLVETFMFVAVNFAVVPERRNAVTELCEKIASDDFYSYPGQLWYGAVAKRLKYVREVGHVDSSNWQMTLEGKSFDQNFSGKTDFVVLAANHLTCMNVLLANVENRSIANEYIVPEGMYSNYEVQCACGYILRFREGFLDEANIATMGMSTYLALQMARLYGPDSAVSNVGRLSLENFIKNLGTNITDVATLELGSGLRSRVLMDGIIIALANDLLLFSPEQTLSGLPVLDVLMTTKEERNKLSFVELFADAGLGVLGTTLNAEGQRFFLQPNPTNPTDILELLREQGMFANIPAGYINRLVRMDLLKADVRHLCMLAGFPYAREPSDRVRIVPRLVVGKDTTAGLFANGTAALMLLNVLLLLAYPNLQGIPSSKPVWNPEVIVNPNTVGFDLIGLLKMITDCMSAELTLIEFLDYQPNRFARLLPCVLVAAETADITKSGGLWRFFLRKEQYRMPGGLMTVRAALSTNLMDQVTLTINDSDLDRSLLGDATLWLLTQLMPTADKVTENRLWMIRTMRCIVQLTALSRNAVISNAGAFISNVLQASAVPPNPQLTKHIPPQDEAFWKLYADDIEDAAIGKTTRVKQGMRLLIDKFGFAAIQVGIRPGILRGVATLGIAALQLQYTDVPWQQLWQEIAINFGVGVFDYGMTGIIEGVRGLWSKSKETKRLVEMRPAVSGDKQSTTETSKPAVEVTMANSNGAHILNTATNMTSGTYTEGSPVSSGTPLGTPFVNITQMVSTGEASDLYNPAAVVQTSGDVPEPRWRRFLSAVADLKSQQSYPQVPAALEDVQKLWSSVARLLNNETFVQDAIAIGSRDQSKVRYECVVGVDKEPTQNDKEVGVHTFRPCTAPEWAHSHGLYETPTPGAAILTTPYLYTAIRKAINESENTLAIYLPTVWTLLCEAKVDKGIRPENIKDVTDHYTDWIEDLKDGSLSQPRHSWVSTVVRQTLDQPSIRERFEKITSPLVKKFKAEAAAERAAIVVRYDRAVTKSSDNSLKEDTFNVGSYLFNPNKEWNLNKFVDSFFILPDLVQLLRSGGGTAVPKDVDPVNLIDSAVERTVDAAQKDMQTTNMTLPLYAKILKAIPNLISNPEIETAARKDFNTLFQAGISPPASGTNYLTNTKLYQGKIFDYLEDLARQPDSKLGISPEAVRVIGSSSFGFQITVDKLRDLAMSRKADDPVVINSLAVNVLSRPADKQLLVQPTIHPTIIQGRPLKAVLDDISTKNIVYVPGVAFAVEITYDVVNTPPVESTFDVVGAPAVERYTPPGYVPEIQKSTSTSGAETTAPPGGISQVPGGIYPTKPPTTAIVSLDPDLRGPKRIFAMLKMFTQTVRETFTQRSSLGFGILGMFPQVFTTAANNPWVCAVATISLQKLLSDKVQGVALTNQDAEYNSKLQSIYDAVAAYQNPGVIIGGLLVEHKFNSWIATIGLGALIALSPLLAESLQIRKAATRNPNLSYAERTLWARARNPTTILATAVLGLGVVGTGLGVITTATLQQLIYGLGVYRFSPLQRAASDIADEVCAGIAHSWLSMNRSSTNVKQIMVYATTNAIMLAGAMGMFGIIRDNPLRLTGAFGDARAYGFSFALAVSEWITCVRLATRIFGAAPRDEKDYDPLFEKSRRIKHTQGHQKMRSWRPAIVLAVVLGTGFGDAVELIPTFGSTTASLYPAKWLLNAFIVGLSNVSNHASPIFVVLGGPGMALQQSVSGIWGLVTGLASNDGLGMIALAAAIPIILGFAGIRAYLRGKKSTVRSIATSSIIDAVLAGTFAAFIFLTGDYALTTMEEVVPQMGLEVLTTLSYQLLRTLTVTDRTSWQYDLVMFGALMALPKM